jgi:hypothetical protein
VKLELREILSRRLGASARFELDGASVALPALQAASAGSKNKKTPAKAESSFEVKELESLKDFRLEVLVKDVSVELSQPGAPKTELRLESLELNRAGIGERFPLTSLLSLSHEQGDQRLRYELAQRGEIDLARLLGQEALSVDLKLTGTGTLDGKPLPELKSSLTGALSLKERSLLTLTSSLPGTVLNLEAEAQAKEERWSFRTLELRLAPEPLLSALAPLMPGLPKVEKELLLELKGKLAGSFSSAEGDLRLTTTRTRVALPDGKLLGLEPAELRLAPTLQTSGASSLGFNARYLTSTVKGDLSLQDLAPRELSVSGEVFLRDLISVINPLLEDLTIRRNDTRLTLGATAQLSSSPMKLELKLQNQGELSASNKDGHAFSVQKLEVTSQSSGTKQVFNTLLSGSVAPAKLPPLQFATTLQGELFDPASVPKTEDFLRATFELSSWTGAQKTATAESTFATAALTAGDNRFALRGLKGKLQLLDFLPLMPKDTRELFRGPELKGVSVDFTGDVDYQDSAIGNAALNVLLSRPLTLRKDQQLVTVEKLLLQTTQGKDRQNLPLRRELEATLANATGGPRAPIRHLSELTIDVKQSMTDKAPALLGSTRTNLFSESSVAARFSMHKGRSKLSDLKATLQLKELAPFLPKELRPMLPNLGNSKASVLAAGAVALEEGKFQELDLSVKTVSPVPLFLANEIPAEAAFELKLDRSKMNMSSTVAMLSGQARFSAQGPGLIRTDVKNVTDLLPRELKFRVSDLKLTRALLQKLIYSQGPKTAAAAPQRGSPAPGGDYKLLTQLPDIVAELEPSHFVVESVPYGMQGSIRLSKGQLRSQNLRLTAGKGQATLNISAQIREREIRARIENELTNFEMASLVGFLPPVVETVTGTTRGELKADAQITPAAPLRYQASFNFAVQDGEVKNVNLTEQLRAVLGRLDFLGGSNLGGISDKFKQLLLRGTATEKLLTLDQFDFQGLRDSMRLTGKGHVGQPESREKSQLTLEFTDLTGNISRRLKDNTGSEVLPLRLAGTELELKPDYEYTLSRVGKGALKQGVETQAKKLLGDFLNQKKKR